jgi:hypothetical protein
MNKLKKLVVSGVGVVALAAPLANGIINASPALATHTCASQREFNRIRQGMPKYRVDYIFDIQGRDVTAGGAPDGVKFQRYRGCSPLDHIDIKFRSRGRSWRVVQGHTYF